MPKIKPLDPQKSEMQRIFRVAMAEKNWTQKHLAEICGLSETRVSAVIRDPEKHNFATLRRIALKLGIPNIPIL